MLFKSLFLILSYECVPVTRLVKLVLVNDTGLARLDFAHLAHPPLLWCAKFHDFTILAPPYVKCKSNVHLLSNV